jgi:type VI secretion system protein ImpC
LCPTEIGITPEISYSFYRQGLIPLETYPDYKRSYAFISTAGSLHKPLEFDDPDTTANNVLSSWSYFLLGSCRFAQYLYCIARDHVGSYRNLSDMQNHLQTWLQQYVCDDPANATDEELARQPLYEAKIVIEEVEHISTYYVAKFFVHPIYQLRRGLTSSMRLLLRLPAVK